MKTKQRNAAQVGKLPGFREPAEDTTKAQESAPEPAPDSGKQRFNLSFDLNEDGSPDFSSMRGKTKDKVKQFFSDPKIAAEFGAKTTTPEVMIFHPAMVSGLYDMLGTLESLIAQKWGNIPEPVAKRVFTYTPAEKEALSGPTVRVLNKYVPDWMIKYQDEIALANLLIAMTVAKVNAAIFLSRMPPSQAEPEKTPEKTEPDPPRPPN